MQITSVRKFVLGTALVIASAFCLFVGVKSMHGSITFNSVSTSDVAGATDTVLAGVTNKSAKGQIDERPTATMQEKGEFHVQIVRPCLAGQVDVSKVPAALRSAVEATATNGICGVISDEVDHNALTFEGQKAILNCYFKATACPGATALYIGLTTSTPSQVFVSASTTALELNSATSTGYARYEINAWTVSTSTAVNNTVSNTAVATWTALQNWNPVTAMFVSTTSSGTGGTAVSYSALSTTRTLMQNDVLNVTYTLTLQ